MKMKSYLLQWQICKFLNSRVKFVISFEGDDDKMKKVATNSNALLEMTKLCHAHVRSSKHSVSHRNMFCELMRYT